MRYTLLRKTPDGIVLCVYHERRLGLQRGTLLFDEFVQFSRRAEPGVWAVWLDDQGIRVEIRPESRLRDGMETRLVVSPVGNHKGTMPKGAVLEAYNSVRVPGIATLLTSQDGREIYEACSAAVLGWDGAEVVCVPNDRPRVDSTSETAIREHVTHVERPIPVGAIMPLLLVNAVKGTCTVASPSRGQYPSKVVEHIQGVLQNLTVMPA